MNQSKQKKGKKGEDSSINFLKKSGHSIVARNFRSKFGEIDIISKKTGTLYFVEVKARSSDRLGKPFEAVDSRKLAHMKLAAQSYLLKNPHNEYKLKLAVISILTDRNEIMFYDDLEA